MKRVTAALIGAGGRGDGAYSSYILNNPEDIKLVALAEPRDERRERVRVAHGIPEEMCFRSWEELLKKPKLADSMIICTQDKMHYMPAIGAIEKGYHLLLEKPMSTDPLECMKIMEYSEKYKTILNIAHVLRYTDFFKTLKKLLDEGIIGRLISIQHNENVAYWHQAMSYVRGPWNVSRESSPMILAKCCHDMDIMVWLAGADCVNVSSYGSLAHFKEENAPEGAPEICQDGCPAENECPWYAPRFYLDSPYFEWATGGRKDACEEEKLATLRNSNHGRCVYKCRNDVVDHQVVCAEFENEVTAAFTMCAFTNDCNRTIKLMGTKGELRGDFNRNEIELTKFLTGKKETISSKESIYGHGGGDYGIMNDFVELVRNEEISRAATSANISLQGHLMAFAAEKSRIERKSVNMRLYRNELKE